MKHFKGMKKICFFILDSHDIILQILACTIDFYDLLDQYGSARKE